PGPVPGDDGKHLLAQRDDEPRQGGDRAVSAGRIAGGRRHCGLDGRGCRGVLLPGPGMGLGRWNRTGSGCGKSCSSKKGKQGEDAERFAPQSMVTREQLVSLLYRYAQTQNMDVSEKADLGDYADAEQVSAYAREAMAWAIGNGIVEGVDAATLAPKGTATRA